MFRQLKKIFRQRTEIRQYINLRTASWEDIRVEPEFESLKDLREMKEPVDVVHELETNLKSIPLKDIKVQLKQMKTRKKYVKKILRVHPEQEIRAIEMLEARKKYPKFAHKFNWKTTVESKIDMLTKKYMLKHDSIDLFIKRIPDKAMTEITIFAELYKKVSKGEPNFSIIAPAGDFKSSDPILLAKSPFGEYYYILCAWDKEVNIVGELLDGEELVLEE